LFVIPVKLDKAAQVKVVRKMGVHPWDEGKDIAPLLDMLSARSANCLRNEKIDTIEQLRQTPDAVLLSMPNFGMGSLREIRSHVPYSGPVEPPLVEIERIQNKLKSAEGLLRNAKQDLDALAARFKP
jgi:hypothetical protein